MNIPIDQRQSSNLRLLLAILIFGTGLAWLWGQLGLPAIMEHLFGLPARTLPQRSPLYEGAPFNDYTDMFVFPNYFFNFSWSLPPAEQIRSWLKGSLKTEFGLMLGAFAPFIAYNVIGIALNFYGMIRLTRALTGLKELGPDLSIRIVAITMLMYPFHFAIDRGNQALHNTGFIILGVALFLQSRHAWAVVNFCLAGCSKVTPYVLGLVFILERRWKAAAGMAALGVALVVGPAYILHLTHQYELGFVLVGQEAYKERYAIGSESEVYSLGLAYSASLFSLMKIVAAMGVSIADGVDFKAGITAALPWFPGMLKVFAVAMALVMLDLVWIALKRRAKPSVLAALLCVYLLMSPHVIADYYLTLAAVPMLIFAFDKDVMHDRLSMVLAALLLVPKGYFWLYYDWRYMALIPTIAVPLNAAIVTILYAVIRYRHVGANKAVPA